MSDLNETLEHAVKKGQLLATSAENILQLLARGNTPIYRSAIEELLAAAAWTELNDRFFKTLAFGTGGLRGRTIGRVVTKAERGQNPDGGPPEFPCVGTNAMNYYNISRATQGLINYLKEHLESKLPRLRPSIAIAHDTRYFSRQFAELAAKVAIENGCDACLFESARSTPELSFAVRQTNSTAGIVVTASHNPPHDNGYKVYFSDGAQVVEPHASSIIRHVNQVASEVYQPVPEGERGHLVVLAEELDENYKKRLCSLVLRPEIVSSAKGLKIVFTPIHGTGGIITVPVLREMGFQVLTVGEQDKADGGFSTVKSPNPENAEALALAILLAKKSSADLVIATDPDCDRMGVAFRDRAGEMQLLTGNQIGSVLAYYRITAFKELGILNDANSGRGVIIKTLVTTDLQKTIAAAQGVRCVETLTGFKYIGEKLGKYEAALPESARRRYRTLSEEETRQLRLEHSSFFVFGGEESYGYSGADFVRDKDGNGAAIMFAEVAAFAKSQDLTLDELLDRIYLSYGYYLEKNGWLVFEGAEGADKICQLAESYNVQAPGEVDGSMVTTLKDFAVGGIKDIEGDVLPKEKMMMFDLSDGRRIAVRPSGTEPKIKFYMFGKREGLSAKSLSSAKEELSRSLDRLWQWLQEDAQRRIG
ncbi:MAG: phospho-sugar mutase [Chthoniobacterales bacterium]